MGNKSGADLDHIILRTGSKFAGRGRGLLRESNGQVLSMANEICTEHLRIPSYLISCPFAISRGGPAGAELNDITVDLT